MVAAQKMLGQKTTLWWMDSSATAAADLPGAMSLAKIAADITANKFTNFTDAIVSPYTLNPTDSDTDDTASVGDVGNSKTRGLYNYEGDFSFFREKDPVTNTTSLYELAKTTFAVRGVLGYWVRRIGYPKTTALAVGHRLEVFYFSSFTPKTDDSSKGKPVLFKVKFGQQGLMTVPLAILA